MGYDGAGKTDKQCTENNGYGRSSFKRRPALHIPLMMMQEAILTRLQAVRERIRSAEQQAGRAPGSVTLLAVSKRHPAAAIRTAAEAGQRCFGESYVQEALGKMAELADLPLEWHFIGPIQSNKTATIAANFHWVHSVEREKIARRLSDQRPAELPPLNVCIQVNISGEASKSGAPLAAVPELAQAIQALPRIRLRGLMAIPAPSHDPQQQRVPFRRLREAFDSLRQGTGADLDTLSMGMSADMEAAIAEGATIVRIGTNIFGTRE